MPFVEYMLLAILGSAGAAAPGATPGGPSTRTFTADAITQPIGGTEGEGYFNAGISLLAQAGGGTTGKKPAHHLESRRHHSRIGSDYNEASRHHRRGRRHTKVFKGGTATRNKTSKS